MGRSLRHFSGFALVALAILASYGCGGDATQPSSASSILAVSSVVAYQNDATPVETLSDSTVVRPLAIFTSVKTSEELVVWGSRDNAGKVVGVHESVVTSTDASSKLGESPLYARYGADGSLVSLKDGNTTSSITFSTLDTSNATNQGTITAVGTDSVGKTATATATLQANGAVTVHVNDKSQTVSPAEIKAIVAHAKDVFTDPLAGLGTVDTEPSARLKILAAVFKVASLVVDDAFKSTITDTEGFLLLNELGESYSAFLSGGGVPTLAPDLTTPTTLPAYRTDLPTP